MRVYAGQGDRLVVPTKDALDVADEWWADEEQRWGVEDSNWTGRSIRHAIVDAVRQTGIDPRQYEEGAVVAECSEDDGEVDVTLV